MDDNYNRIVTKIRKRPVQLATNLSKLTSVLMQGSGIFAVESTIGTAVPKSVKVAVINNDARIVAICKRLGIEYLDLSQREDQPADLAQLEHALPNDPTVTHVAVVLCETTTGLLNPVEQIGEMSKTFGLSLIVDAMSSFGGIPMSMEQLRADFHVSSANRCIQGVPGFGFVIADREKLIDCQGQARSLSLDLYDQWREMERNNGKWRYTSPTHVVRAFEQALDELDEEGCGERRFQRYSENQRLLVEGMQELGFHTLVDRRYQLPFITAFRYPDDSRFQFEQLYSALKRRRFVIYPGKVSHAATFRVGTIGHVFPDDIQELLQAFAAVVNDAGWNVSDHEQS